RTNTGRFPRGARLFLPLQGGRIGAGLRRSSFPGARSETSGPSCYACRRLTALAARDPHLDPPPFRGRKERAAHSDLAEKRCLIWTRSALVSTRSAPVSTRSAPGRDEKRRDLPCCSLPL